MTECFDNFIDGESAPGASTRPNINPSDTTDVVGDFACASMSDCERAIAAAANAKYGWARSPIQNRYEVLKTASDEILDRREELGQLLAREEGKTLPEGIGEATRAGQIFAFFAGECLRQFGETGDSVRPGVKVDITREPVGAHFGLTPRRFQSGEIDIEGHISKCGDADVRATLYTAANALLTRSARWSPLKAWGMKLAKTRGHRRAVIAVARKLAVILHRVWIDDTQFRWGTEGARS